MWHFRPGVPAEQQLQELEKELSFENLRPDVATSFETAGQQEARETIAEVSGTLYKVIYFNGKRYRVALTEF